MDLNLKLFLIFLLISTIVLVLNRLRRKKIIIKYAIFWIILSLLLIISVIVPNLYFKLAHLLGFETASNMIFLIAFFALFYLNLILINTMSKQSNEIKNLVQELSILKERVSKNERKK